MKIVVLIRVIYVSLGLLMNYIVIRCLMLCGLLFLHIF